MSNTSVTIYTDGAARNNPGRGGYGVVLQYKQQMKELSKGYRLTTNNRMELMAVIKGLEALTKPGLEVTIYSDSSYVVNAVMKGWLPGWVKTGFKGKKNEDLWRAYLAVSANHKVKFVWVKGHAENRWNNRCDELATEAADGHALAMDEGYEKLVKEA